MLEVFKLLWDVIVLRDAAKKGQLSVGVWIFAIGFVLTLYLIALPLFFFYTNHPGNKAALVAGILVIALDFTALAWFVIKRRRKTKQLAANAGN